MREDDLLSIHSDFNIHRKDIPLSRGGGVLVAIHKCFSSVAVELESDIEICFVRVKITFFHALIGVCCRPPNTDAVFI